MCLLVGWVWFGWCLKKPPRDARQQNTRPLVRETGCNVDRNALAGVVRLARGASLLCCALSRVAQLLGRNAPSLRVTQTGGEEIIDQPCHGTAQPPAFMIQCADDDPVDAGRVMGSSWHGGWVRRLRISPGRSSIYNADMRGIAGRADFAATFET
jgi:hypothetical protein